MTEPMHTRLELMVEGHPLIEHKTFPLPAAVRFGHLFEVIQDATLKMMDLGEPPLLQKAARFLTADATGAEHGDTRR